MASLLSIKTKRKWKCWELIPMFQFHIKIKSTLRSATHKLNSFITACTLFWVNHRPFSRSKWFLCPTVKFKLIIPTVSRCCRKSSSSSSAFSKPHIQDCVKLPDVQEVFALRAANHPWMLFTFWLKVSGNMSAIINWGELCKVPEEIHLEMLLIRLCHQNA